MYLQPIYFCMQSLARQFQQDGYLVLEQFNTEASCEALMQRAMELAASFDRSTHPSVFQTSGQTSTTDEYFLQSGDRISFFFEKEAVAPDGALRSDLFHSLNKIGHALHDLDPLFDHFSRSAAMKSLVEELGLSHQVIIQSMMIFKHARIGGVVDVHQDSTFLYTEPESCVGFWFALEDATCENGCLWARPGGHQTSLRSWFRRKPGGGVEMNTLDTAPYDTEGMIPLEVKKGALIVLHGLLPHYSLPNTSGRSRQAYAIHTIDPQAHYPSQNWLHRDFSTLRGFA